MREKKILMKQKNIAQVASWGNMCILTKLGAYMLIGNALCCAIIVMKRA